MIYCLRKANFIIQRLSEGNQTFPGLTNPMIDMRFTETSILQRGFLYLQAKMQQAIYLLLELHYR